MVEHYSHIRVEAKRAALDAIAKPVFLRDGHKIGNSHIDCTPDCTPFTETSSLGTPAVL